MTNQPKAGIFLVDDDADTLAMVECILRNRGYDTVTARDGEEALMHLTTQHFDLIISDVDMPRMDGLRLLELLRTNVITTPLIFITVNATPECEIKAKEYGAAEFISKPIRKQLLLEKVSSVLAAADA
ncbi:MAG: response regulator [Elusimicrobiales bacterium]